MNVEPFAANRKLVRDTVDRCLSAVVNAAGRVFGGRMGRLKVALGAALLSVLVSFPSYRHLGKELDKDATMTALEIKFHNPLASIPPELKDPRLYDGDASHNDKLELRLTLPVLGWLSHTGKWTIVIWSPVCGLIVFYLLARLAGKALDDDVGGALFVLALAPTFFGAWFFNDYDCGDGVAFLFLALAMASSNPILTSAAVVLAAFADERSVTAVPLLLVYFAVSLGQETETHRRRRQYFAIFVGVAAWCLLRWWVALTYHLAMGTSMVATRDVIGSNFVNGLPYVFFNIFRALWGIPLAAAICLWARRRWCAWMVWAGAFAVAATPAFLVFDFDRSLCYTFPVLLSALYFVRGDTQPARKFLAGAFVANVLLLSPGSSILRVAGVFWPSAR